MRSDDSALRLWAHEVWGRISWKPFEIETWFQRTTDAESNGHVTDNVTWPRKVKAVTLICLRPRISKMARDRVGTAEGLAGWTPSSCLQTRIFQWKIGFKFQSLGKISNISTSDPPSSFTSIPTLARDRLGCNEWSTYSKWGMASRIMTCQNDVMWPWQIEVPTCDPICLVPIISKTAGDKDLVPRTTNRKWPMESRMVRCLMTSRVSVFLFGAGYILTEGGQYFKYKNLKYVF